MITWYRKSKKKLILIRHAIEINHLQINFHMTMELLQGHSTKGRNTRDGGFTDLRPRVGTWASPYLWRWAGRGVAESWPLKNSIFCPWNGPSKKINAIDYSGLLSKKCTLLTSICWPLNNKFYIKRRKKNYFKLIQIL